MTPPLVELPGPPRGLEEVLAAGSLHVFVATRENAVLKAVRDAGAAADLRLLIDPARPAGARPPVQHPAPPADAGDWPAGRGGGGGPAADAPPVRVAVRYGGIVLARGVEVPRGSLVHHTSVPWHGGALEPSRFEVLEEPGPPGPPRAAVLLVAVRPALSALEQAVLDRIPPEAGDWDLATHAAEMYGLLRRAAMREKLRQAPAPSIDDPV